MADTDNKVVGELFVRQYIARSAPIQDSLFFRNRLDAYLHKHHYSEYAEIASYLRVEAGLVVSTYYAEKYNNVYYNFTDFFAQTKIEYILSSITLIWRYLKVKFPERASTRNQTQPFVNLYPKADAWRMFVARALREENVAYIVDEHCGVHFFVDEEFARNRVSALSCLTTPRYGAVRAAFEQAHTYLDAQPIDTKGAVRSAFESLEILARLMDPSSKNLNKWMVENKLKPLVVSAAVNATESLVIEKVFAGLAQFVDSIHPFRHGQGTEAPVAPSVAVAVFVVSSVASVLRWLANVEALQRDA